MISLITSDIELLEVYYAHTVYPIAIAALTTIVMVSFIASQALIAGFWALLGYCTVGILMPLINSRYTGKPGRGVQCRSSQPEPVRLNCGRHAVLIWPRLCLKRPGHQPVGRAKAADRHRPRLFSWRPVHVAGRNHGQPGCLERGDHPQVPERSSQGQDDHHRLPPDIEIDSENLGQNGTSYYIVSINGRDYEVSFNAEKLTKLSPRS